MAIRTRKDSPNMVQKPNSPSAIFEVTREKICLWLLVWMAAMEVANGTLPMSFLLSVTAPWSSIYCCMKWRAAKLSFPVWVPPADD